MGQYYYVVNLDKREYLHPHRFGDGLKLLEFGCSGEGTMNALAVLLADGNNRGGGDLHSDNPIIGSWANDRIVVAGDYADEGKFLDAAEIDHWREFTGNHNATPNLHTVAGDLYKDVSYDALQAMCEDKYIAQRVARNDSFGGGGDDEPQWLKTLRKNEAKQWAKNLVDKGCTSNCVYGTRDVPLGTKGRILSAQGVPLVCTILWENGHRTQREAKYLEGREITLLPA